LIKKQLGNNALQLKNYELYKPDTSRSAIFCLAGTGSYSQKALPELPFFEPQDSTFHESIKREWA